MADYTIYANGQKGGDQYIRNQNVLSNWEDFYTYNNNSWVMNSAPFDGFVTVYGGTNLTSYPSVYLLINDVIVGGFYTNSGASSCHVGEIAFRKGDKISFSGHWTYSKICFYKLRDYSDRT